MDWNDIKSLVFDKVSNFDVEYKNRLDFEIKEIEKQGTQDYWSGLVEERKKFNHNKNGLVLPFLLGITGIDPIIGELKIMVGPGSIKVDGVVIELENGSKLEVSCNTKILTDDGFKLAKDLTNDDYIIYED